MIKKILVSLVTIIFLLSGASFAFANTGGGGAQGGTGGGGVTGGTGGGGCPPGSPAGSVCLDNPLKANSLDSLFKAIMDAIFIIAMPVAVLAMAFVGFKFVAARGNPEKLAKARQAFLYTVVGVGVFFGAWVLVTILASLMRNLGVPI